MNIRKAEFPILEYDENSRAAFVSALKVNPKFPKKAALLFLKDTVRDFAERNDSEIIGSFQNISEDIEFYKIFWKGEPLCYCRMPEGAPAATQVMDFLIHKGVSEFVATGSCGALTDIPENEFFIPVEALRDEGTSYKYLPPSRTVELDPVMVRKLEQALSARSVRHHRSKVWSTDGIYRETPAMISYRREEGCHLVDMECAALAACAKFRGVRFGQLLFTADSLLDRENHDLRGGGYASFSLALELALDTLSISKPPYNRFKLIVLDLDGTVLKDDKSIGAHTMRVLDIYRKTGSLIVVATARTLSAAERYLEKLSPDAVISSCGAVAHFGRERVYYKPLDPCIGNELIQQCRCDAVQAITATTESRYYSNIGAEGDPDYRNYVYTDFSDPLQEDILKISCEIPDHSFLSRIDLKAVQLLEYRDEDWKSFLHPEATKGSALNALMAHLKVHSSEVIAFGDDLMDIALFERTKTAVAMGNAVTALKMRATHITDTNNEEGVATFLEKWMLMEEKDE